MEHVALNDRQLSYLAYEDPVLKKYYVGTFPCDRLPKHPDTSRPRGYIVNTDPMINQDNIGLLYGLKIMSVKSWIVMRYLWITTVKPNL